jgi:hypothetical protein
MSIGIQILREIKRCLPAKSVLSLSYPDIISKVSEVNELFGIEVEKTTSFNQWHGKKYPLPDTEEVFEKIGCKLRCVDIVASRGCEEIVDLNYPVDLGQHDIVIDGGTSEHVFMIGQSLMNAANAVRPGGKIIQGLPVTWGNHGFYNVCPTVLWDFYTQNGWDIELFCGLDIAQETFLIRSTDRQDLPPHINVLVVAKRVTSSPMKIPAQTKYLKSPTLS